jgi:NADH-quinone oxidoreductase subunit C
MNSNSQFEQPSAETEGQEENASSPLPLSPDQQALVDRARQLLHNDLLTISLDAGGACVMEVIAERAHDLLQWLKEQANPPVSYLSDLHGLDGDEKMAVVYHLFRPADRFEITVKALTPRSAPRVPSVSDLWPAAQWPEREVMELFGIQITGHPDPRKLLLPDDWRGYPLRKDYHYPADHPYLSPDPLHEDPAAVLSGTKEEPETEQGQT